jgi:L-threonylcarbamoyladenylate synthase
VKSADSLMCVPMPVTSDTTNLIQQPSPLSIDAAVSILKRGGLVALPTETVYGLGADASNPEALKNLYAVKGRPGNHPVIVHLARIEQLSAWAKNIPQPAWDLALAFWPGPLTLILPRTERVPDAVTGGQDTVGIRIPSHPVARALLEAFDGGLAAPSANRFGRVSPTTAEHVLADLGADVDLILDGGACDVGVESTIVAFPEGQPVILRPGMITAGQIAAVLGISITQASGTASVRAPGTLSSHYAPKTPVQILDWGILLEHLQNAAPAGQPVGVLSMQRQPESLMYPVIVWRQASADAGGYAQGLYANLRALDQLGLSRLYVEAIPNAPEWSAIEDRLKRAAYTEGV